MKDKTFMRESLIVLVFTGAISYLQIRFPAYALIPHEVLAGTALLAFGAFGMIVRGQIKKNGGDK